MRRPSRAALLPWLAAGLVHVAAAQTYEPDKPEWAEQDVPAAPAFRMDKLISVAVDASGGLRYGIDPATLSIGKDGVVRYVMVAQGRSAMTAMYEGIRCTTGDYKTYARFNDGHWAPVAQPEWRSMRASSRIMYPLAFASQGGCDLDSAPTSVLKIVERLRATGLSNHFP